MPQGRDQIIDFSTSRLNECISTFHATALACSNQRTVGLNPANRLAIVPIFSAKPINKLCLKTLHCKIEFC